ncbi:MAG: GtrA family protein [Erythrobacter sp.]
MTLLAKLQDIRFIRYILASVGALVVDFGSFLLMLSSGTNAAIASAFGYSFGILAHWVLSSRTVFQDTVAQEARARTKQKALFVVSALVGLVLTATIVGIADASGIDARGAKLVAIIVSFSVTYYLRAKVVFSSEPD